MSIDNLASVTRQTIVQYGQASHGLVSLWRAGAGRVVGFAPRRFAAAVTGGLDLSARGAEAVVERVSSRLLDSVDRLARLPGMNQIEGIPVVGMAPEVVRTLSLPVARVGLSVATELHQGYARVARRLAAEMPVQGAPTDAPQA